ncbi:MAG: hypothetical protein H6577_12625 [Lewinellaceae bacterium]|nr:hypothetical protein [Saprospiraceae bacterium]MCB9338966.1 hypothetical protein [Lewinellaceae bacterium]
MKKEIEPSIYKLYEQVKAILLEARNRAYRAVHVHMVTAHWQVGKLIFEEEQNGEERASYGEQTIKSLASRLIDDFGKTYNERTLYYCRQFYAAFPILNALRSELSWTHYRSLLRVKEEAARYLLYLPSEAELIALLRTEVSHFNLLKGLAEEDGV